MYVQICARICNFLYPLSKRNQRLWSLVEAEWFMNPGHLSVIEIRQNTKANTPQQKDSDAHLQEWPQDRTCEHPTLETEGTSLWKTCLYRWMGERKEQKGTFFFTGGAHTSCYFATGGVMVPKGRVVTMEGGARCPHRLSSTEHAFTDTAHPEASEGPRATVGLLPGSSGKTPPQSPGRKRHPTVSRTAQPCDPKCGAGLPVNHGPGKQRQRAEVDGGQSWISKCPEGPDRTSEWNRLYPGGENM